MLRNQEFINRHKISLAAFTRVRKLTFIVIFILILRNSVKSLQLALNEFVNETEKDFLVTAGAFTKARKKLKHTAYIELNENIVDMYYKENKIKRFRNFRILAFDASAITLPTNNAIREEFGSIPTTNGTGADLGEYSRAIFQSCYDVINNVAVYSILDHGLSYEVDLAEKIIPLLSSDDLSIFDRGYASYAFMAKLIKEGKHFIIRCSKGSFSAVMDMFKGGAPESMIVTINATHKQKKKVADACLPNTIKIRLVRIILSTGEVEVLATTLLDDSEFSNDDFNYLYSLRWGVETFFSKIKGRLALENFTGKTVESIYQDFWSTIFISNVETIMVEDIEEDMNANKPDDRKIHKINKAVSFNVIKNMAFEIFFNESDQGRVISKLTKLFRMNPIVVRKNRQVPRKKISITRSFNFQKRARKHIF
jgi:hypothetical protein